MSWATNVKTEAYAFTSDLEADESVTDILRVVGMSKNFRIHAPDYPMQPPAFETVCDCSSMSPAFREALPRFLT